MNDIDVNDIERNRSDAPLSAPRGLPVLGPPAKNGPAFEATLASHALAPVRTAVPRVLQLNLGKLCNQSCRHCHVGAGPDRKEVMDRATVEACLSALARSQISVVDITGGAPELNPHFRDLVDRVHDLGRHVIDRCNLTILEVPRFRDLPAFFAERGVELICSLPHMAPSSTDRQRGDGVYEKSIRALSRLNDLGYGQDGSGLRLVLVTNPVGAFLPGDQAAMERDWKRELLRRHGIRFNALYCLTNMPIGRFADWLLESGNWESYLHELMSRFNPGAVAGLMCRDTVSVGWDGKLYDCDFNQMLDLPMRARGGVHISDVDLDRLANRPVVLGTHCFGCTAGAGSSCGGSTASATENAQT